MPGWNVSGAVLRSTTTGTRPGRSRSGNSSAPARTGNAVRHRLPFEGAERGRFPGVDRRAAGIADGEVALPCRDRHPGAGHLHFDVSEAAVVRLVDRGVADQVVIVEIAFDPVESLLQIVGVLEQQPARSLRQSAESVVWILAQNVLIILERLRQRLVAPVSR